MSSEMSRLFSQGWHTSVVLICPRIPLNTGAIGRSCLGFNTSLHLVNPFFRLSPEMVNRAGLDYWPRVDLHRHEVANVHEFVSTQLKEAAGGGEMYFFSGHTFSQNLFEVDFATPFRQQILDTREELRRNSRMWPNPSIWDSSVDAKAELARQALSQVRPRVTLVFGSETLGFRDIDPAWLKQQRTVSIPMHEDIRSFNLATSAALAMYECRRQESRFLADLGIVAESVPPP